MFIQPEIPNEKPPTGAVMVVGGGIAGMQASLDLADQGFKVYLVEANSAIGGKMAQLDKTFPTNDCAMCTISPKLVETGRHPNIEILTGTQVQEVNGQVGDFSVTVWREPRYVKIDKCIACGDCTKVCPVTIPDLFNEGLSPRRAAYKLYPQAVPNAFAIEKRGIAPCRDACPASQRAQGYIALIREGRWADALRVIKMDNPFPGICGRICNHRCETACNRGLVDEPINIRALKRFVTDKVYAEPRQALEPVEIKHPDRRVAIIGAGPAGLTAAQDIIRAGYPVTIFEAMPVAGGMLRLGVPEYRLPTDIIEREVQDIVDLGVDLRLNHQVNNLDDVFAEGFAAVLIAVGAHEGIRLPLEGANLEGVLINTHFLRDVRLGKFAGNGGAPDSPTSRPTALGSHVLVLGGGNVAIDVARSAVRLGCQVSLACLESRESMPAHAWEVQAAEEEGVSVFPGRSFERILGDENGRASGVECLEVSSFSFDESGRLNVEKIAGSNHVIPCDTVIFSVGQRAGLAFIPDDAGVGLTSQKTIAINPNTFAATRTGVFAAGDSVSGTAFVIEAVDSGHKSARSIIRFLTGEGLEPAPKPELPVVRLSRAEIESRMARGEIHRSPRIPLPELPVNQRIDSFAEIEAGYDDLSAQAEAARCLACGICSECMSCTFACGVNAIDHDMVGRQERLQVGAIILAPGYQAYHAELSAEFGYGRYPNVLTALQFERLLSASGPTLGHVHRPSDHKPPQRVAFLQCIGSRDQSHDYCSAVCCMYATKEAVIAKEHQPDLDVHVFMMDMRAFSKGYWDYFERARSRYGVQYHRARVSALREDPRTHDLILHYPEENGELRDERFDMVVLSVGMEMSDSVRELGRQMGIELDEYGFCHTVQFNPLETSRPGIYAAGPFREPKDIPESVVEASGAAAAAAAHLAPARFTLTTQREFPPERDVSQEEARVGVFVCSCGSNIGGFLDVPEVTEAAAGLPHVAHSEWNLYACSQDSIQHITEQVKEHNLNRVVVASCTPLTHQPLFQDSLRAAGLNPYLFEMANIRNQCSWVHSHDREAATQKAKDLVRMSAARAALLEPQHTIGVPVQPAALVVGGGAAGMTAALALAGQGFQVHLVEKTGELGGNLRHIYTTAPPSGSGDQPKDPQSILQELVSQVRSHPAINLHLESRVSASTGFMGNFTSTVQQASGDRLEIRHGVTILATGGQEYRGPEYGYGTDPRILTQQEFEFALARDRVNPGSVIMILCVGPGEKYCSRICCSVSLKNAIRLKELNPAAQVVILYKDIRTYGFKERLYTEARERGVIFVRYDSDHRPEIGFEAIENDAPEGAGELAREPGEGRSSDSWPPAKINVRAWDAALDRWIELHPELVVLSMPVVPQEDAHQVAGLFKVSLDADNFFLEAHVKLRPVDFASDGIFMAGMAHYPKLIDETMIQAQAAASRAARVLSREALTAGGRVAEVDASKCTGCLTCVRICPFGVPKIQADLFGVGGIIGAAYIEAAVCQGCGSCVAECPARAIQLHHYTDSQVMAKVEALLNVERVC
ncbi:MAG TPA: FAD-dependent oxidoreductase [Anaerolineales bacterium]